MPWTTPVDRTTGYTVTANDWNLTGQDDLAYLYGDTAWTNMGSFASGWVAAGSPNTPRFRLQGTMVSIQGAVSSGTANSQIGTMPVGYRPSQTVVFTTSNGGTTFAAISITNAGVITQLAGTNSNLHLSCTYSTL